MDGEGLRPRLALVAQIEQRIGPIPPRYRDALLAVDRALYVREVDRTAAWIDEPLPLDTPFGAQVATISAPHVYVLGFDALGLTEGDRLLELGSGSGYGAALAAKVVGAAGLVTTVEADPHLMRLSARLNAGLANVRTLHDDGLARADLLATHPKCWLTFSVEVPPIALLEGMREGGVLVAPVGPGVADQRFVRYRRRDGRVYEDDLGAVRFVRARPRIEER
jgi:protein-L-isoaspartate(D-aspartate) O-methyltransferase